MPDRDVFDRRAPRGWATALRHLCGCSEADIVAKAAVRSLTKTVKTRGGIPGAPSVIRLVEEFNSSALPLKAALARLQRAERTMGDHVVAAPGIEAAKWLLVQLSTEPGSVRDIPHALALQCCVQLVDSNLFGSAPDLVGARFPDVCDLQNFKSATLGQMMPALDRIAQQLASDATASTLAYPRRVLRPTRRPTADILHEPLT